jgi:spore germination cell wall hydrolase CwlJ-like protein
MVSKSALYCLTENIYHEARGEGLKGMFAVGHVTINRSNDWRWPDNVCEVVHQKNQFSWTSKPKRIDDKVAYKASQKVAIEILAKESEDNTEGSVFFHTISIKDKRQPTVRIGNHAFYR